MMEYDTKLFKRNCFEFQAIKKKLKNILISVSGLNIKLPIQSTGRQFFNYLEGIL